MRATRALAIGAPVAAALVVIGAVISIAARWPHQFGGRGSRDNMFGDFISSGTALAPPLFILVVFLVAAFLATRQERWGTVACVVLILLSVAMIVGSVGEATAPAAPDVPRAVQLLDGVLGTLAGLVVAELSIGSLLERRTARRAVSSAEGA